MFKELKNAIEAAEYIISNMAYDRVDCVERLDRYSRMAELDDYDKRERDACATRADLYNEVENFIVKWVKAQI